MYDPRDKAFYASKYLKHLFLEEKNILIIPFEENWLELELLDLSSNKIENVTSLSKMLHLKFLDLTFNNIENIEPFANLINLEELHLSSNKIVDIEPLAKLTNLKKLYLDKNRILNFEVLKDLQGLQILSCSKNPYLGQQIQLSGLEKQMPNCIIGDGRRLEGEEYTRGDFYWDNIYTPKNKK